MIVINPKKQNELLVLIILGSLIIFILVAGSAFGIYKLFPELQKNIILKKYIITNTANNS